MADITVLARLFNGATRNVDLTSNTPVVFSLKVGGGVSNTELTKAILDKLILINEAADADGTFDSRYTKIADLASTANGKGASLVGVEDTAGNFTATTVEGVLAEIFAAAGSSNANQSLSNLTSPTAINQTLQPASATNVDLGAGNNNLRNIYAQSIKFAASQSATEDLTINSSSLSSSSGSAYTVGTSNNPNSGALTLKTGNADVDTNSGNLNIQTGTVSGTGVRGKVSITANTVDVNSTKIINVTDPTSAQDAATKNYVDTLAGDYIPLTQKGAANGVATLDAGQKVPVDQLPNSIVQYISVWDASTNTPELLDFADGAAAGTHIGDVYKVSVAGTVDFGSGNITFVVGDYAILNNSGKWELAHSGADAVNSVNGQAGIVVLDTDDISEGTTNLYFTDERAQDAVGAALTDSTTVDFTYDDTANTITAIVKDNSISAAKLTTGVADQATITGGDNTALAVQYAPANKENLVAGESFAATTLFAVRFAKAADADFVAGRIYKADTDASTIDNFYTIGLVFPGTSTSAGTNLLVTKLGLMNIPSHGFTIGAPLFLSASGAISSTAPTAANTAVVRVGLVRDANNIDIQIQVMGVN